MTFKKLVQAISEIESYEGCKIVAQQIKESFEANKITWKDHVMLWSILNTYYNTYES